MRVLLESLCGRRDGLLCGAGRAEAQAHVWHFPSTRFHHTKASHEEERGSRDLALRCVMRLRARADHLVDRPSVTAARTRLSGGWVRCA